ITVLRCASQDRRAVGHVGQARGVAGPLAGPSPAPEWRRAWRACGLARAVPERFRLRDCPSSPAAPLVLRHAAAPARIVASRRPRLRRCRRNELGRALRSARRGFGIELLLLAPLYILIDRDRSDPSDPGARISELHQPSFEAPAICGMRDLSPVLADSGP